MPPRLRPPAASDAPAVLAVIVARDVADLGVPDFTLEDVRADWARPGVSLADDARVAGDNGSIHAYAILLGDDAVVAVHPDAEGCGTGTLLRRWAEARAAERGTAVLRQFTYGSNDRARRLLHDAGYAPVAHFFRLRGELAALPGPDGTPLRTFEAADEAAVHALVEGALAEIEGREPRTREQWRATTLAKEGHDPSLWLLLEDEQGLAGAALGERWEDGVGYLAELAVAPRARGRGHGRALLLGMFEAFRRARLAHVELSVQGRNRSALRLYESVGLRSTWEAERWEKALGRP